MLFTGSHYATWRLLNGSHCTTGSIRPRCNGTLSSFFAEPGPGKTTSARFTKFAGYLLWGISFSGKEISLILKNKMGAAGISLKNYLHFSTVCFSTYCRRLNVFIGDMYNRYICPLQLCRHLTLKLLIQGHPWSAKVTHILDFKSGYISLLLILEVCNVKPTHGKSCAANLLMWSDLTLDHSFKVKRG